MAGPIQPLFDIDLGARFQKHVTLTFMLSGVEQFRETVSVLQSVGKLRSFVAERLAIPCKYGPCVCMGHREGGEEGRRDVWDSGEGGGVEAGLTTVNGTITNRIENCQN